MSAKYQRIKQRDLLLPAPLRWLTRAFSSITLAVILLILVALYGTLASVPVAFLAKGALYLAVLLFTTASATGIGYHLGSGKSPLTRDVPPAARRLIAALILTLGVMLNLLGWYIAYQWVHSDPWFQLNAATVIYRLPYFEMTELEFYSWWPLRLILNLFVLNMIWATIRRIEFKWVNSGVLMVHAGIVTIAVAAMVYGHYKIEGTTFVIRKDLGGRPVAEFFDATRPALFFLSEHNEPVLMIGLDQLPRYNDSLATPQNPRPLRIDLSSSTQFKQVFGEHFKASINEFYAYGKLQRVWNDADAQTVDAQTVDAQTVDAVPFRAGSPVEGEAKNPGLKPTASDKGANPALKLSPGERDQFDPANSAVLVSGVPGQRAIDAGEWAVEFLYKPDPQRLADLESPVESRQSLVVEVPAKNFRQVYAIQPGQTIEVADTGYSLKIQEVGPYGLNFATQGYEGATDTRATVEVTHAEKTFRRMVMHRYPERSQDFTPAPDDPTVGPMGRRSAPDPAIRMAYLDGSKAQYHLFASNADLSDLTLIARLPGHKPIAAPIKDNLFPISVRADGQFSWLHIVKRIGHAEQVDEPVVTPKAQRKPKDEGTYKESLLPIDLETTVTGTDGKPRPWKRRVWLTHMPFLNTPDPTAAPAEVEIPGLGKLRLAFSRLMMPLPFAIELDNFQMKPYPGTRIPQDFIADMTLFDLGQSHGFDPSRGIKAQARLNNPLVHHGIKISQAGWDPGDPDDPANNAVDSEGRFLNQQRYSILQVGNNVGIRFIFLGSCLMTLGIPFAFYVKPAIVRAQKRKLQRQAGYDPKTKTFTRQQVKAQVAQKE